MIHPSDGQTADRQQADRQTDGRTDGRVIAYSCYSMLSRDADKPALRKSMQKLLQFDVFRFISPNSISPEFQITDA